MEVKWIRKSSNPLTFRDLSLGEFYRGRDEARPKMKTDDGWVYMDTAISIDKKDWPMHCSTAVVRIRIDHEASNEKSLIFVDKE
jgi:hypothetical protein